MLHTVRLFSAIVIVLMASSSLLANGVSNIGSAFSYQGRLTDNGGTPQSGSFDFRFSLYDASIAGTPVSTTVSSANVTVTNGVFTVMLDFGSSAFDGSQRWLEIEVRASGGGVYTTLSPRQEVKAVPYSLQVAAGAIGANQLATPGDGAAGQVLTYSTTSSTGVTWASVSSAVFDLTANTTATIANVNTAASVFVFGARTLEDNPNGTYDDTRFFFDRDKGAFFAGTFEENNPFDWDNDLIGDNAVSMGYNNIAEGDRSVAMGGGNRAIGIGSIALGARTDGFGLDDYNRAEGNNSLAVGSKYNISEGDYSIAFGHDANRSVGDFSLAMGRNDNRANGNHSIALGNNSNMTDGDFSIAMGSNDNHSAAYSMALGTASNNASQYSIAIGNNYNRTVGNYTLAMGQSDNRANASYSLAIGNNFNQAGASYSLAFGQNDNRATAMYTMALGYADNKATGTYSLAVGSANNLAGATYTFAMGSNDNKANGNYSMAHGKSSNHADGDYSMAFGLNENHATGNNSLAFGSSKNRAEGNNSLAFGSNENIALGANSVALGYNNLADATSSIAIGRGTSSESYGETALGIYPTRYTANSTIARDDNDRLLVIGNGVDELNRADALTIWKSGKVDIYGDVCATSLTVSVGVTAANLSVGTSGVVLTDVIKRTVTVDVSSIAANSSGDEVITFSGAATQATVSVSTENLLPAGLMIASTKSNNGSVTIRFYNATGSPIDPASMEFYITVIR